MKTRYKDTTRFGSDFGANFHDIFMKKMRNSMLSLQRECKFSKIDVFIISVIFSSKSVQKETKNEGFWDEVGSKIHSKNVLKFR